MNTNERGIDLLFIIKQKPCKKRRALNKNGIMSKKTLSQDEELFCQLLVNGTTPYGGNIVRCYRDVFHSNDSLDGHKARKLMAREDIKAYIEQLEGENAKESVLMKKFLAENLKSIVQEMSTAEYRDRKGTKLSPAALRSVAVSASKALMDLYPVKEAQINKLNIEGNGENGIVFNVIVPNKNSDKSDE